MTTRPSQLQLEHLVDFLEQNSGIAKGLIRTAHAKLDNKKKWEELALTLNSLGGANKNGRRWAKYWAEKKCALKRQIAVNLISARRTGGGISNITQFSPLDARLVALMGGQRFATGDPGVSVHPFPSMNPTAVTNSVHLGGGDNDISYTMQVVEAVPTTSREVCLGDSPPLNLSSQVQRVVVRSPSTIVGTGNSIPITETSQISQHIPAADSIRTRRSQNLRRQRPSRHLDVEMDRLSTIEERRVEAELKTAKSFENIANKLDIAIDAVSTMAVSMTDMAAAMTSMAAAMSHIAAAHVTYINK